MAYAMVMKAQMSSIKVPELGSIWIYRRRFIIVRGLHQGMSADLGFVQYEYCSNPGSLKDMHLGQFHEKCQPGDAEWNRLQGLQDNK